MDLDLHVATDEENGAVCLVPDCDWTYFGARGRLMAAGHMEIEHPRLCGERN